MVRRTIYDIVEVLYIAYHWVIDGESILVRCTSPTIMLNIQSNIEGPSIVSLDNVTDMPGAASPQNQALWEHSSLQPNHASQLLLVDHSTTGR
jgi:hypothetical protein